ncbi:MAG: rod shape-determining protein RodA [Spirochaetes bacterium]|nr:rod shape-determining protein RodA [Spirochaetota bacterium]
MKLSRFITKFDYILFISMIALTITGILFIYSANLNKDETQSEFIKQIIFSIISFIVFIIILLIPLRKIREYSFWIYIGCIIGLLLTLVPIFPVIMGQRRLMILGFSIQFADFAKLAVTLLLAQYYILHQNNIESLKTYLIGCIIVFLPVGIILLHPDLGSALVFIPILLGVSYIAGVRRKFLLYTMLLFVVISLIPILTTINRLYYESDNDIIYSLTNLKYIALIFSVLLITILISLALYFNIIVKISERLRVVYYWYIFFASIVFIGLAISYPANHYVLKQYQKDRLLIFFNPYIDPQNKGFHIIQSMNTVGNGGIFGKGWKKGEQTQNFFVPEQATDFIYPVIAEEKGFIGSIFIIILYVLLFYRGFLISYNARDYWSAYVVIGIICILLFHILENIGMCIGIMPITGIPLPFLSYGGSFLIACYIAVALMMNISLNRFQY